MRQTFFEELYQQMKLNENIYLICIDLGYGGADKIRDEFPDRFINPGAAEQVALDIAVGLALSGKIPFVYSITPFLLYRPFETIRTYINHEKLNVKLIGSGRDDDYKHDGFSHFAGDDEAILFSLKNIHKMWPDHVEAIAGCVKTMVERDEPAYLNLKR